LLLATTAAQAQTRGTLIIMGGGPWHDEVQQRFVELSGGAKGTILVLPMASQSSDSGRSSVKGWQELGAHARALVVNRDEAMRADTAALFKDVTGIWFGGGDQSRLTAAIAGTPVEAAIRNRYLNAGAVVGGTSAGAAVMSRMMITGDERRFGGNRPPSDSSQAFITIDRDNVITTAGFGYIDNAIIDQHFVRRRRHNRLISLVLEHPQLIGAGIDESTAIEVRPDGNWRVLGESVVVIYDARRARIGNGQSVLGASGVVMHVLPSGTLYNPKNGKASFATRR
ncbi:MAG TPA: cyanophycinase, partial [Longimicrobiales bacterium]|nr:cyanophycinase [Longimicrobiales bacterium]